jgi:hypothetical protein
MEQRPLRLGDIVDDYCPRERRLTNHAIVAVVAAGIRQTRCLTCDADHPYKHGKLPRQRKKSESSELYEEVLSNVGGQLVIKTGPGEDAAALGKAGTIEKDATLAEIVRGNGHIDAPPQAAAAPLPEGAGDVPATNGAAAETPVAAANELWVGHRPLIRATLPRDSQPATPRPIPEFTMRQQGMRNNGHGRPGHQGGGWPGRGGPSGDGFRSGHADGRGRTPGAGGGQGRNRSGRGKRSR